MKRIIYNVSWLILCCMTACAQPKLMVFRPWTAAPAQWRTEQWHDLRFKVPAELPRVFINTNMVCFLISGYKNGPVSYVPSDAVYVEYRDAKMSDLESYAAFTRAHGGVTTNVFNPVRGCRYWTPAAYHNSDNSRKLDVSTEVEDVEWGYFFSSPSGPTGRVFIQKSCNKRLGQIKDENVVTQEERILIDDIARTVQRIQ